MKFTVTSSALCKVLQNIIKIIPSKNTMPILDNFLFDVQDGNILVVTASSEDKSINVSVPLIDTTGAARFCVLAKQLLSAMKDIPDQPIVFDYDENSNNLIVRHTCGKFSVMCQEPDTYPSFRSIYDGNEITISSRTIVDGIGTCAFAGAFDDIIPFKNCICMDIKPDMVIFVATDGRKMVRKTFYESHGIDCMLNIPRSVAKLVSDTLNEASDVALSFDNERAVFRTDDTTIYFRQIEAKYPNYNSVIPIRRPHKVVVVRESLLLALKRVGVFCNKSSNRVELELKDDMITLTGKDNDYSTSSEEFIKVDYKGDGLRIGFSCTCFIEILSNAVYDYVTLEFDEATRPIICLPGISGTEDCLMLLMPMKIE